MFSKRLKELRKEFGYTQAELAKLLQLEAPAISKYELGLREPSLNVLNKLSEIFNVSVDYITGKTDIRNIDSIKDIRMASYNGVDVNGLSDKEIEEIKQFVEFVRNKNKK